MKVFISHTHNDTQIAERIAHDLYKHGVEDVWFGDLIKPGESWTKKISEAIHNSNVILVVVSRKTTESQWQTSEIALGVAAQRDDPSKRIIPVLVHKQAELPFFLKDLVSCDLSSEEKYEQNLGILLRALTQPLKVKTVEDIRVTDYANIELTKAESELLGRYVKAHNMKMKDKTYTLFTQILVFSFVLLLLLFGTYVIIIMMGTPKKFWLTYVFGVFLGAATTLIAILLVRRIQKRNAQKGRGNGK